MTHTILEHPTVKFTISLSHHLDHNKVNYDITGSRDTSRD